MALVAEACLCRHARAGEIGLAQQTCCMLHTIPRHGFGTSFAHSPPVSRTEPGRMSALFSGEVTHTQGDVLAKAPCNCGSPVRRGALRLTVRPLEKAPHVCAQPPLECFAAADLRQPARLGGQRSAQPPRYGRARKGHVPKPGWIELDLDLFETRGGDHVLMGGAGPV